MAEPATIAMVFLLILSMVDYSLNAGSTKPQPGAIQCGPEVFFAFGSTRAVCRGAHREPRHWELVCWRAVGRSSGGRTRFAPRRMALVGGDFGQSTVEGARPRPLESMVLAGLVT